MSDELSEFTWIDVDRIDFVGVPANGVPAPLLAKAAVTDDRPIGETAYFVVTKMKYSAADLDRLRSKGHTLPGTTSYPIGDDDDLRRAVRAVGRGKKKSHNEIRVYVMRRAREMGHTDWVPTDWASDGSLKKGNQMKKAQIIPMDLSGSASTVGRPARPVSTDGYMGQTVENTNPALEPFEERVANARTAVEKATGDWQLMKAKTELEAARKSLFMAKMVNRDNAREQGRLPRGRFGPNSTDLFGGSTHTIGDDIQVRGF